MQERSRMLKVITPVENKNGKTFWIRVGNAFPNRDGSTNVYLNAYPTSGKLQIREIDERPTRDDASASPTDPGHDSGTAGPATAHDELPF